MSPVQVAAEGAIAVVTVDNPPVNALSHAVRLGLADAVAQIDADPAVRAAVLVCAGRTFIAGADITEFGKPPADPALPDLVARLERSVKPWVAAIHGTALGGGLEVALGCHYRIADAKARLGFPEVELGLIPGAGGTVRLPRLIDPAHAVTMVAGGKPVTAAQAAGWGLVDRIADGDLREAAHAFAQEVAERPVPPALIDRPPVGRPDTAAWETLLADVRDAAGARQAPPVAAAAIRRAVELPAAEALARERQDFLALRDGAQSRALRHIFLAERSVPKLPELQGVTPRPVDQVAVIGGGTMGAGIAAAALLGGYAVTMIERDEAALARGQETVRGHLDGALKRNRIDEATKAAMLGRFTGAADLAAAGTADLAIEAVFEDLDLKRDIFGRLGAVARPDAVLATNTSYLDVGQIARAAAEPTRVIGLHFFSPAHVMRLIELVRTDFAAPDVLATGLAFAHRLGKIAVPTGVCDGFIGNRIMSAYRRDCEFMLEDGALPHEIDRAMTGFGFPMGIFAMQDLAGLEIGWATRKRQAATRDPAARYVAVADHLCELGRFGRKAGAGFYAYPDGRTAERDPVVEAIVLEESARKGITRRAFSDAEIMARILGTMQAEGERILAEGIAAAPEAIDVVMVDGYGFPRWRGGPMFMRDRPSRGEP